MPRKSLGLKSRMGCKRCKRRRVKCDEKRQICGECTRLQRECSYLATTPFYWGIKTSRCDSGNEDRVEAHTGRINTQLRLVLPKGRLSISQESPSERELYYSLEDMRLLHHFSNKTAITLSDLPKAQKA